MNEYYGSYNDYANACLAHYGVLGMHWGVRKQEYESKNAKRKRIARNVGSAAVTAGLIGGAAYAGVKHKKFRKLASKAYKSAGSANATAYKLENEARHLKVNASKLGNTGDYDHRANAIFKADNLRKFAGSDEDIMGTTRGFDNLVYKYYKKELHGIADEVRKAKKSSKTTGKIQKQINQKESLASEYRKAAKDYNDVAYDAAKARSKSKKAVAALSGTATGSIVYNTAAGTKETKTQKQTRKLKEAKAKGPTAYGRYAATHRKQIVKESKVKHSDYDIGYAAADFTSDYLAHYGVLGMHWGIRKRRESSGDGRQRSANTNQNYNSTSNNYNKSNGTAKKIAAGVGAAATIAGAAYLAKSGKGAKALKAVKNVNFQSAKGALAKGASRVGEAYNARTATKATKSMASRRKSISDAVSNAKTKVGISAGDARTKFKAGIAKANSGNQSIAAGNKVKSAMGSARDTASKAIIKGSNKAASIRKSGAVSNIRNGKVVNSAGAAIGVAKAKASATGSIVKATAKTAKAATSGLSTSGKLKVAKGLGKRTAGAAAAGVKKHQVAIAGVAGAGLVTAGTVNTAKGLNDYRKARKRGKQNAKHSDYTTGMYGADFTSDYLAHYGVLGMHWGVRHTSYPIDGDSKKITGSEAASQKRRWGDGYKEYKAKKTANKAADRALIDKYKSQGESDDARMARLVKKKKISTKTLSTQELQQINNRLNANKQYKQLSYEDRAKVEAIVASIVADQAVQNSGAPKMAKDAASRTIKAVRSTAVKARKDKELGINSDRAMDLTNNLRDNFSDYDASKAVIQAALISTGGAALKSAAKAVANSKKEKMLRAAGLKKNK